MMQKFILAMIACFALWHESKAQSVLNPSALPREIYVENTESSSHVQGIAVDLERGYAYFSFTTTLIKTDLQGHIVGSVTGFTCHLGCIDLDPATGKLYGSIEYKDDAIGRGVMKTLGQTLGKRENTFYIGIFDTERIDRQGINCETGGVMTTVFLPEVVQYYEDSVMCQGRKVAHRYGCSGIDGLSIGPRFGQAGKKNAKSYVYVDVAMYGDKERSDNDYQILLEYDLKTLEHYAQPLDQAKPHHVGPKHAKRQLYVLTGNTSFGIQNLEYDAASRQWFAAAYKGAKPNYSNFTLFAIDGTKAPVKQILQGHDGARGLCLTLSPVGTKCPKSGVYGWPQNIGQCGIESLGNGYFYISRNGKTKTGREFSRTQLHRYQPSEQKAFVVVP